MHLHCPATFITLFSQPITITNCIWCKYRTNQVVAGGHTCMKGGQSANSWKKVHCIFVHLG